MPKSVRVPANRIARAAGSESIRLGMVFCPLTPFTLVRIPALVTVGASWQTMAL